MRTQDYVPASQAAKLALRRGRATPLKDLRARLARLQALRAALVGHGRGRGLGWLRQPRPEPAWR